QVFVSLMLVVSSLVLFAFSVRQRDHEHAERLSLFPLEDDASADSAPQGAARADSPAPALPQPRSQE
ncbi:MAG: hypothetical protein ACK4N5_05055, partial [Myxococcales bacterium]